MMLSAFIWALNIFLFNGLPALRLLQIKDYHWARIKAHFYQPSSKNLIFNIKEIAIYIFLFLTLFLKNIYLNLWPGIITLLIFLIWRKNLKNYLVWTAKASLLALVQIFILTLLLSFSQVSLRSVLFLSLFIVQLIIITSVSEIINHTLKILSYPFRKKIKEKIIKAKKELGTMSILIVGSYGKSSVKHYLVEILQKLSNVCAPPERVNHEFALIKFFMKREIKALVDGGSAKPMPPLGPALSAAKLPVNEVIAKINEATKSFSGMKVPVTIIYEGSNYEIVVETPPITELIKKEAKIEKGASNKDQIAGNITMNKLIELAKSTSSNSKSVKARLKELIGTCQSMGITIDGKKPKEIKDI